MSGEGESLAPLGFIPGSDCDSLVGRELTLGDIAARIDARRTAAFDQRPGAFEATRDLPHQAVYVLGARLTPGEQPWGVLLMVRDADGTMAQACVTPDRARELARELDRMAAIAEGVMFPDGRAEAKAS